MSDESALLLRELHDAHSAALLRYVARLTQDHALAQDVVQESLLRAWRNPRILQQGDEASRAWIFTVARNLVIDDRRSARFRREHTTDRLPDEPVDDGTDAALDRWMLADALLSLSREHRAIIVDSYYLGRTAVEISRLHGIPEGTVRSRAHYALRSLRLALQERGMTR